jgi:hypothetical protein
MMQSRPLPDELIAEFRQLIDSTIEDLPENSSGRSNTNLVRHGLYEIQWVVTSLKKDPLERVAYILDEIGFKVELMKRELQRQDSIIPHIFYALNAQRNGLFHPDYLYGEAILVGTVADMWDCHLDSFNFVGNYKNAARSIYGSMGSSIASL